MINHRNVSPPREYFGRKVPPTSIGNCPHGLHRATLIEGFAAHYPVGFDAGASTILASLRRGVSLSLLRVDVADCR
jgi:hypothetical protein